MERTWRGEKKRGLESPAGKKRHLGLLAKSRGTRGSQTPWLAPMWEARGTREMSAVLQGPTSPMPSQDGVGSQGPGGCQSPPLFHTVPTSRSPCPTLEETRGLQSLDDAPTLLGPLQSAISSQIIKNLGLRIKERSRISYHP